MGATRVPPAQRQPNNPRGYFSEPDNRPRIDSTPGDELGQLQRLREALPLLSVGVSFAVPIAANNASLGGWRHASPEPRIVRCSYPGVTNAERIAFAGLQVYVEVVEGVDSRGSKRRIHIPLQGLTFTTPAGIITGEVFLYQAQQPAADNTFNVTTSAGYLSTRLYSDPDTTFQVPPAFPAFVTIAAPAFATSAQVFILSGSLASPFGTPIGGPGTTAIVAIGGNGVIQLSSTAPNTSCIVSWVISE